MGAAGLDPASGTTPAVGLVRHAGHRNRPAFAAGRR